MPTRSNDEDFESVEGLYAAQPTAVLTANLSPTARRPPMIDYCLGSYIYFKHRPRLLNASGGAGVSCLGDGNARVRAAMISQIDRGPYAHAAFFPSYPFEALTAYLVETTHGHMERAAIFNSGSETTEAAIKLARQYFVEIGEPKRLNFIARHGSYHGITIGALSISGHPTRRSLFEEMLLENVSLVSSCNPYRGLLPGENLEQYVKRLQQELDDEFKSLGPETVCAFVVEPIVGAALGCVGPVPGYFAAMKSVCDKYGALLIFDEVMCGLGRTGTLHAWEQDDIDIAPDIQMIGKGLAGGYQPVSGILASSRVVEGLRNGSGAFSHGQTFQGHPLCCAAALEVQHVIRDENLVASVKRRGRLLGDALRENLSSHPHVGNIRGRGFLWGIEFVKDKSTKTPFPQSLNIAQRVRRHAEDAHNIAIYCGTGSADGINGDHIMIMPPFNIEQEDFEEIVPRVRRTIEDVFNEEEFQSLEKKPVEEDGPSRCDR
ncbi:MAG: hypothetical protein M1834_006035 [Cirrosporium novae-zelandiae]|nr:MAG: hypothetical protein M1834_006035 [Cirrosporium novae-zelandiae]